MPAQELRYAVRSLWKSPGFTVTAVLLLSIGFGANATIFSLVNSILLRPVPGIAQADRLAIVGKTVRGSRWSGNHSYPDYRDLAARNTVFAGLASYDYLPMSLSDGTQTDRVAGGLVSGNFFQVLGVRMGAGRLFGAVEDSKREAAAVISEALWNSRWNRDPAVVGKQVTINGKPFTIIGVAGAGFRGVLIDSVADVWIPLSMHEAVGRGKGLDTLRDAAWIALIGRLKPGVSLGEARAQIGAIGQQLAAAYPADNRDKQMLLEPYSPVGGGAGEAITFLSILVAVAGLALLIVCANVANLLIARASSRQREIAIRTSLGAARWRIVRQMLVEGLVLSSGGVLAGLIVTLWTTAAIERLFPIIGGMDVALDFRPDLRVLAFSLALAFVSTATFVLAPAFTATRLDLAEALKSGGMAVAGGRSRLRSVLAVVQVGVGLLLIVCAGLLTRSYANLKSSDPRVNLDAVLLASIDPDANGYDKARGLDVMNRVVDRVSRIPGVQSAALAMMVPFGDTALSLGPVAAEGQRPVSSDMNLVGPGYFATIGVPILRGRDFRASDTRGAPNVAIINQMLARTLWPTGDPIGKTFRIGDEPGVWEIAGVAANIRYRSARDHDRPFVYLPVAQSYIGRTTIHVRGANPAGLVESVRRAVLEVDRNLPVFDVRSLRGQFDRSLWTDRLIVILLGAFGAVAALVAAIGLYAVMSFHVTRKTREIGIRMALGASISEVLAQSLRDGIVLTAIGAVLGLGLSLAATQVLRQFLFGVTPADPWTLAGAVLFLAVTAGLASIVPARRAARVEPMIALRYE
jgi:predicted permease